MFPDSRAGSVFSGHAGHFIAGIIRANKLFASGHLVSAGVHMLSLLVY
jgi:hypothetical protein